MNQKLLIVGDKGREDAFARMAEQSGIDLIVPDSLAYFANKPGAEVYPNSLSISEIARLSVESEVTAVYLGPDQVNVDGYGDVLKNSGVDIIGVTKKSGRFEGSKIFSAKHNDDFSIPQPGFYVPFNIEDANMYIHLNDPAKYVIKADGLARGKGVFLPNSDDEARQAVREMLQHKRFGKAGERIMFQQRIYGPEVSVHSIFGKDSFVILPLSQDHKRLLDGDKGPNTGGKGAYTGIPESIVSTKQYEKIEQIHGQIHESFRRAGIDYEGPLYMAFILDQNDQGEPKVLEYNVRFGDPEAQVLFPTIPESLDFMQNLIRVAKGQSIIKAQEYHPRKLDKVALSVCLSGEGYPETNYNGSRIINGANQEYENCTINHGNTYFESDGTVWSDGGGRMIHSTGVGDNLIDAHHFAYSPLLSGKVNSENAHYRTDIGRQAISPV